MAPVWCNDPDGVKILFMGRDGGTWDIFSIDASSHVHSQVWLQIGPGNPGVALTRVFSEQMEAVLASQRRTHSLLELSLGSAFDAELEPPGVQP